MILEKADDRLRQFGEQLMDLVEELAGTRPELISSGDQYRAAVNGPPWQAGAPEEDRIRCLESTDNPGRSAGVLVDGDAYRGTPGEIPQLSTLPCVARVAR